MGYASFFSVAHPTNDNAILLADYLYIAGDQVAKTPVYEGLEWCHRALTVDVTQHPAYKAKYYLNGTLVLDIAGTLKNNASILADDNLAVVFGADQDSVLGGWDTSQIFSGHLDEARIWNGIRTDQQIHDNFQFGLKSPYPPELMMYYNFDDSMDALFYENLANPGDPSFRMYQADYSVTARAPTLTPSYSPPAQLLPVLAVSTAPLCGSGAQAAVRVPEGQSVNIEVERLFCGASGAPTITVKATDGITVVQDGKTLALGDEVVATGMLQITAASTPLANNSAFQYSVTDGNVTVMGSIDVLPDAAPQLGTGLQLVGLEDTPLSTWVIAIDPDNDVVFVALSGALTGSGTATMDPSVQRQVTYTAGPNQNGFDLALFNVSARDTWGAMSGAMPISVSLKGVPDPPTLTVDGTFRIFRGQRIALPFQIVDVDGNDPFLVVSDWPAAVQGELRASDGINEWAINECHISSRFQWVSNVTGWSTQYADHPGDDYGAWQVIGPPQTTRYGDSPDAWCPDTMIGGCVNRAPADEAYDDFYTEFLEVAFAMPMYISDVIMFENYGGDRVSRILVPSDRNEAKWKPIYTDDIAGSPATDQAQQYSVFTPQVCQGIWSTSRLRIEMDTCHRAGWYEVDAIQMRGGVLQPVNILNVTQQLALVAAPGFTGNVTFGLTATTCLGSYVATSEPELITVEILDPPYSKTLEATEDWTAFNAASGVPSAEVTGPFMVLELPTRGTLRFHGQIVNSTLVSLGSQTPTFEYLIYRCDATESDTFVVQLSPTAVVLINVQGCKTSNSLLLVSIVIPICVVLFIACLTALLMWRKTSGRDNRHAPRDSKNGVCVLFTDIQASTTLWGEVPNEMSAALDIHHAIIRRLIKKYRCYEVKTIGDSFMIVSKDPHSTMQLALAIQEALHAQNWGTTQFDRVYREQTGAPTTPTPEYAQCWNGLRVRIGINFGSLQVTFDDVTRGYDYYGPPVNTAARIEGVAHGGQVVVSAEFWEQVSQAAARGDYSTVTRNLGRHLLRGVAKEVELVQVLPASLSERQFPPLRLDHADDKVDEDDVEEGQGSVSGRASTVMHTHYPQALDREVLLHPLVRNGALAADGAVAIAYTVFYTIKSLLNMHKGDTKVKRLRELCQLWHVPCQSGTLLLEDRSVGRLAMQVMGSVANQQRSQQRGAVGLGLRIDRAETGEEAVQSFKPGSPQMSRTSTGPYVVDLV